MRGGSVGTWVLGPESHKRALESLKGSVSLAIDVLLVIFWGYFQLKSSILREVSACPRTESSLVPPCKISLGGPEDYSINDVIK